MQAAFLDEMKAVLPKGSVPVIVVDGAFARPSSAPAFARAGKKVVTLSVFTLGVLIATSAKRIVLHVKTVWRQLEKARRIQRDFFPPITPPRSGGVDVPLPQSHGLFCADGGWKGRSWGWPK